MRQPERSEVLLLSLAAETLRRWSEGTPPGFRVKVLTIIELLEQDAETLGGLERSVQRDTVLE